MFRNRSLLVKIVKDDPSGGDAVQVDVLDAVKNHFERNKETYLTLGVAGITLLIMRKSVFSHYIRDAVGVPAQGAVGVLGENSVSVRTLSLLSNKPMSNIVTVIESGRQGPPSWVIRCKETGDIFMSQRSASIANNLSQSDLSMHLNGMVGHDTVNNLTFSRICVAA